MKFSRYNFYSVQSLQEHSILSLAAMHTWRGDSPSQMLLTIFDLPFAKPTQTEGKLNRAYMIWLIKIDALKEDDSYE